MIRPSRVLDLDAMLDLSNDLATRHAARQLRASLVAYVKSDAFDPELTVEPQDIERLIEFHQRPPVVPSRAEVIAQFDQKERNDRRES